ncbi:hypothetical protein ACFL21_04980, partial [Patescibacteria group bacterium]
RKIKIAKAETKGISLDDYKEIYDIAQRRISYGAEEDWQYIAVQSVAEHRENKQEAENEALRIAKEEMKNKPEEQEALEEKVEDVASDVEEEEEEK